MQNRDILDPTAKLQAAIKELDLFTRSEVSCFDVGEDEHLVAASGTLLERVVGFARSYIGPFFSEHMRQEQEKKLSRLKQVILEARDIVQSHSALIEKLKHGDEAQQKLAEYALKAIQRYNAIVADEADEANHVYNYERKRLLLDEEIKGHQIQLPYVVSIEYDSHSGAHPAQKMLKELSETLLMGAVNKQYSMMSTTHKETAQYMIDAFRMKAIRMIQDHLPYPSSMSEILQLIKQTPIHEEMDDQLITMKQLLEIGPGAKILLTGSFKRYLSGSKFMAMPILDSFRFSSQLTHTGFPYPSQHTGWALADKWIEACPLRVDQAPLFQQMEQRKKRLAHLLLFDQELIHQVRRHYQLTREVFDQERDLFLPLHGQLQRLLRRGVLEDGLGVEHDHVLEAFYEEVSSAPSAFDLLVQTQEYLLDLFIRQPLKDLEEEWLKMETNPLRVGSPQEKFQAAYQRLEQRRQMAKEQLDPANVRQAYILIQGSLLGKAFQAIGLQYQSEKMGFAPPLLKDFERKLQACAFQQLLTFMDECESGLDKIDSAQIKQNLLAKWSNDLKLFQESNVEDDHLLAVSLTNELEVYFNSRFFASYSRSERR